MEQNLTEKRIIAEAKRIFMQKGFEATKMDDIAKACNINRPGLNYYFRTKEKLFEAIYKQAVGTALPSLERALNSGKGLEAVTREVVRIYMHIIHENPSVPYFLLNECTKDPDRLSVFIKNLGMDIYVRSMENFRKQGKIREVPLQALLLYFYSLIMIPPIANKFIGNVVAPKEMVTEEEWGDFVAEKIYEFLKP